jgi:hypothetical protein
VRELVEATVFPLSESLGHDDGASWYARFLRQVIVPDFDVLSDALSDVTTGLATVVERLRDRLGWMPEELRGQRIELAFGLIVNALADHESLLASSQPTLATPLMAAGLVDAAVAVLGAPMSDATARALHHATLKGA